MGRIPTFSRAERERRWARVRELMTAHDLVALVGLPSTGHFDHFQADVRYLTQIGGNFTEAAVVFPADGEVTAIVRGDREIAWWSAQQDWVTDLRASGRFYSTAIAARLRELGHAGGRIGILGLEGLVRAPEGVAVWGIVERLRQALPDAVLVDATQVAQEARAVKSPEEIRFVRNAAMLAEAAVERMIEIARPGVPEREVYAAMLGSMIVGGGEIPTMILLGVGRRPPWPQRMLTDRRLRAGDIINNEVEARWAGYIAQVVAPCVLGPVDAAHRTIFELSARVFDDLVASLRPGVAFAVIQKLYRDAVEDAGFEVGGALLHGRGLGEDRPIVWGHRPFENQELALAEGMVFVLKPAVFPPGGRDVATRGGEVVELALRAGDTVVVTASGGERLGKRPLKLLEL